MFWICLTFIPCCCFGVVFNPYIDKEDMLGDGSVKVSQLFDRRRKPLFPVLQYIEECRFRFGGGPFAARRLAGNDQEFLDARTGCLPDTTFDTFIHRWWLWCSCWKIDFLCNFNYTESPNIRCSQKIGNYPRVWYTPQGLHDNVLHHCVNNPGNIFDIILPYIRIWSRSWLSWGSFSAACGLSWVCYNFQGFHATRIGIITLQWYDRQIGRKMFQVHVPYESNVLCWIGHFDFQFSLLGGIIIQLLHN